MAIPANTYVSKDKTIYTISMEFVFFYLCPFIFIYFYSSLFISNGIACPHKIGEDKICFDIRVFELSEDSQDSRLTKEMFPRIVILEPLSGTSCTLESELAARCSNVLVKQTCKNKKQD